MPQWRIQNFVVGGYNKNMLSRNLKILNYEYFLTRVGDLSPLSPRGSAHEIPPIKAKNYFRCQTNIFYNLLVT